MTRHAWPDPNKIAPLICSFHEYLTIYEILKTETQLFVEILAISYFEAIWAFPGMSDHTQLKCHDQFVASVDV